MTVLCVSVYSATGMPVALRGPSEEIYFECERGTGVVKFNTQELKTVDPLVLGITLIKAASPHFNRSGVGVRPKLRPWLMNVPMKNQVNGIRQQ
jgi:hypothetical protein